MPHEPAPVPRTIVRGAELAPAASSAARMVAAWRVAPAGRAHQTPHRAVNAFTEASLVEHRGLAVLLPYLEERAYRGRLVSTAKGPLARTLQRSFGDFFINLDADTVRSLEIKVERHWTGNLFLETWSNLNLEDREAHAEYGSTPGWMVTSRADLLLFYFLDTDDLVTVPLLRLKRWAFGSGTEGGIYAWPEKRQGRFEQRNDTWGRCVPVGHLAEAVGARRTQVRQLCLLAAGAKPLREAR